MRGALLAICGAAALAGGGYYVASGRSAATDAPAGAAPATAGDFTCTVADVHDGDTFRCAEHEANGRPIRIRVAGISAREVDGTCRPNNPCPSATADAATGALRQMVSGAVLSCQQNGTTYDRRAAFCRKPDGTDVSCAMVATGTVLRWDRYWAGHRCP